MNRLIFGADEYLKTWTAKQIGIDGFGLSVAIGVQRDGEIIAAAVYHDLRQGQIEASIASTSLRWASRSVLHALFAYPFNQVGANRLRQLYAPHDAILWGMLKDECKWIRNQDNGKIKPATSANA
jgi:hypothetical protein